MKKNTNDIIKSFTSHMSAMSSKVEENSQAISTNLAAIGRNTEMVMEQGAGLGRLEARVRALEQGHTRPARAVATRRAVLLDKYLVTRRSLRLWPITGMSVDDLWASVERFLGDKLSVPSKDLNLEDVELVRRVTDAAVPDSIHDEAIVVPRNSRIRSACCQGLAPG